MEHSVGNRFAYQGYCECSLIFGDFYTYMYMWIAGEGVRMAGEEVR